MKNSQLNQRSSNGTNSLKQRDPQKYARLMAEAQAPYKGLRSFIYLAFGASGSIGALVFLAQLAAGKDVTSALPNFALQVGLVVLMVWLFRWEKDN